MDDIRHAIQGSRTYLSSPTFQASSAASQDQPFLNALSQKWPEQQVAAQFERWTGQDLKTVTGILSNAPPSDFRTAGIKGMLTKLEQNDPSLVAEWRERLSAE